mmetsp:Transcript_19650/g.41261  ORF Transcript_19650/g.41261 Transcript_19650/m.41261 type:complete len:84 (+) Transcript_19650:243-494(+)
MFRAIVFLKKAASPSPSSPPIRTIWGVSGIKNGVTGASCVKHGPGVKNALGASPMAHGAANMAIPPCYVRKGCIKTDVFHGPH